MIPTPTGANSQLGKSICSRIVSGKICFSLRNQRHHTTVSLGSRYFKLIFIETFPTPFQEPSPAKSRARKLIGYSRGTSIASLGSKTYNIPNTDAAAAKVTATRPNLFPTAVRKR